MGSNIDGEDVWVSCPLPPNEHSSPIVNDHGFIVCYRRQIDADELTKLVFAMHEELTKLKDFAAPERDLRADGTITTTLDDGSIVEPPIL